MQGSTRLKVSRRAPRRLRPYTVIRCPKARYLVGCRMLCTPKRGLGMCGRLAPHLLKGKTQRAIEKFQKRKKAELRLVGAA